MRKTQFVSLVAAAVLFLVPQTTLAYVGPGAGLSVIGTLLALIAAGSLAIVGFVWYPVKRMRRKRRARHAEARQELPSNADAQRR
ncbi:MAG: hypothetical protein WD489_09945 [Rhodovibrionaceae bacterium]